MCTADAVLQSPILHCTAVKIAEAHLFFTEGVVVNLNYRHRIHAPNRQVTCTSQTKKAGPASYTLCHFRSARDSLRCLILPAERASVARSNIRPAQSPIHSSAEYLSRAPGSRPLQQAGPQWSMLYLSCLYTCPQSILARARSPFPDLKMVAM